MKTFAFGLIAAFLCLFLVPESKATIRLRARACNHAPVVAVRKVIVRRRVIVRDAVQTIVIVPQVILQDVQRDHYYSVGDQQYQELLIQAAMARLMVYQGHKPPYGPSPPQMPPANGGVQATEPPAQRFAAKVGSHQDAKLVAVVKESCVKCHGVGSPNSTLMIDGKLAEISEGLAWKSFGLVNAGEMPKASEALKDDKVTLFYEWAKAQKGKK